MYKKITIIIALLASGCGQWQAESVCVVVPKQYLQENASLVVYLLDALGNQSIGTCALHEAFEKRIIGKQDLLIQDTDSGLVKDAVNSIEISKSSQPCDNEVVLYIDFDAAIQIMRILLVKNNLLADNPFDILSIQVGADSSEEDDDSLTNLASGVDHSRATHDASGLSKQPTSLEKYALYAQIFCMMQYAHAKHMIQSWVEKLCKKNK